MLIVKASFILMSREPQLCEICIYLLVNFKVAGYGNPTSLGPPNLFSEPESAAALVVLPHLVHAIP